MRRKSNPNSRLRYSRKGTPFLENFYILKLSNQKPRNQILEERVRELEASANTVKEVTKADLASAIPKLVLMTQVFGNIVGTILSKEKKDLDCLALKNIFKEY